MPTYDYKCYKCNKYYELVRTLKEMYENPKPKCKVCGARVSMVFLRPPNVIWKNGSPTGRKEQ